MTGLGVAFIVWCVTGPVELRGRETPPADPPGMEVVAVSDEGVALGYAPSPDASIPGAPPAAPRVALIIGWDRVSSVTGPLADQSARYRDTADRAWRARTRLERGDAIRAEPLFEDLFSAYRGQSGATAAVVAEGLLRCRLRRGAHVAAVEAWAGLLRASPADQTGLPPVLHSSWAAEAGLSGVIDPDTGLIPAIPPIWLGPAAARVLDSSVGNAALDAQPADSPPGSSPPPSDKAALLWSLYVAAARFEAGLPAAIPASDSTDSGVLLVRLIVLARAGDGPQRAAARDALRARMTKGAPEWVEAWCRAAIGRSLVREDDLRRRQLGVVELLQLPARFGKVHPYLAGMALAEASATLRSMGDAAGADALRAELSDTFKNHPVLDWEPMRTRAAPRPPAPVK